MAGHFETDGRLPMPQIWEICIDCFDMQSGDMRHWPLVGGWAKNRELLDLMRFTWSAWRIFDNYFSTDSETEGQRVARLAMLDGYTAPPAPPSKFELWKEKHE